MDKDKILKKTEEDTTNILLEFIIENSNQSPSKTRSRSKSVEKAKQLLKVGRKHSLQVDQEVFTCTQTVTEDGFVLLSKQSEPQPVCQNRHLSAASCGSKTTCAKRPATLALQPAPDPGDPPLFSPCQSYPPPTPQSPPAVVQTSHPKIVPGCENMATPQASPQQTARIIAERLRLLGDKLEKTESKQKLEDELRRLASSSTASSGETLLQNVTTVFRSIYNYLSLLNLKFGDLNPPEQDKRWQLFCMSLDVLRTSIVPSISSLGGWAAFLTRVDPCEARILTSPRSGDSHALPRSPALTHLPIAQSTPAVVMTSPRMIRALKEYQPSPGSTRSMRIVRSHTLPSCEPHPRKLWRLSESGSLVDEDGNDNFSDSLKSERELESDLEGSIALGNAHKFVDQCDSDMEKDDLVFPMDPATTNSYQYSFSSPVIVASPHGQEGVETEPLCDSGHVSSSETLSLCSTPPRDISFTIGNASLHSLNTDSAVDVSNPQATGEKRRPKSGCSFSKKEAATPFDRTRSRSMPASQRPKKSSKRRTNVIVPPCESPYNNGSISLSSISETVLYEAVRSLLA